MTAVPVPGSAKLSPSAREARTRRYRTWRGQHPGLAWCAECLLCGDWRSGYPTRELAAQYVSAVHAASCHVLNGCHCPQPHLTAVMAARLGIRDEYPRELAGRLFALAGGTRRYLPPHLDRRGTPHGGPEHGSGGYRWAG